MLQCTGIGPIPEKDSDTLEHYLKAMVEAASRGAPVWPVPVYRSLVEEISLSVLSCDEIPVHSHHSDTESDELSFDYISS